MKILSIARLDTKYCIMATITSILQQISFMRRKTGAFAINKEEFFSILEDMVDKIGEVNNNTNSVAKSLVWQSPVPNFAALAATYLNPERGWAAMVKDEGYIYSWNGEAWKNTGLTAFPRDVALKARNYVQLDDPASEQGSTVKDGDAWIYTGTPLTRYERINGVWINISGAGGGSSQPNIFLADTININGNRRTIINLNGDRNFIVKS